MGQLFEFKLPDIGEGVSEGEIVAWHVKAGDVVKEDDPMVEVMTDKATVAIGAPRAGTIRNLNFAVGAVAKVGAVLVVIETAPRAAAVASPASAPTVAAGPAATAVGDIREGLPGTHLLDRKPAAVETHHDRRPIATPAVRKLARDLGVDLSAVRPSARDGRVSAQDVELHAARAGGAVAPVTRAAPHKPVSIEHGLREERRPFVGVRRKIAERMQHSKQTAAHFTFVEECDASRLHSLRDRLRPEFEAKGVKLSLLPFIVKATVAALKKHPILNSALDESTNELVYKHDYHIGIATATDQGLVVPVLRDADSKILLELAHEIERLSTGARAGKLGPAELTGSTFSITSLGKQGGLFATPILNFPEVAILGVHQVKQKPVVRDGQITIGEVMLLSLSFDHRIVDGHVGAAFAYDLIAYLEEPALMFLERG